MTILMKTIATMAMMTKMKMTIMAFSLTSARVGYCSVRIDLVFDRHNAEEIDDTAGTDLKVTR